VPFLQVSQQIPIVFLSSAELFLLECGQFLLELQRESLHQKQHEYWRVTELCCVVSSHVGESVDLCSPFEPRQF
jgi:hypothetical protein